MTNHQNCHQSSNFDSTSNQIESDEAPVAYTCPMHPNIRRSYPGLCPECGMNLVPTTGGVKKNHSDHDQHQGHQINILLRRFWVALILTIPLVVYSELTDLFLNWQAPRFAGYQYLMLIIGSIVFFYGGWLFLTGAYRELRAKLPGMMTLIALAITAAYLWSLYATFTPDMTLWWELATLITIMLLGHYLEMRAVKGARGALKELAELLPKQATVIRGGQTIAVSIDEIKLDDIAIVKPGEKIPADGVIEDGISEINEAIVTGESKPTIKQVGHEVIAGTINGDGGLKVKVTKIGDDTFLANVRQLVAEAEASKSRLQILSDQAALILTIIAVSVGTITLLAWLFIGQDTSFAVARLVAVLVIACPHALGLAVPLTASISTNMAAAQGFIIKQRLALEAARNVDVVLFDKTGTLTRGEFGVVEILTADNHQADHVLTLAASVNSGSEHPIGRAIVKAAQDKNIKLLNVSNFNRLAGKGAQGQVAGQTVLVGSQVLMAEKNIQPDQEFNDQIKELESTGKTVILVIQDDQLLGAIALADIIRTESKLAIEQLHEQGLKVAMITGDSEDVAAWVAQELKIDEYFARVLPEQKVDQVKELQNRGLKVAMVGDGVNDAPALTQADVGIAIGAGTNVAIESAGIILVKNNPLDIPKITRLSRLTYTKMIQNLFWATGYNIIALPLAAGALVAWGVPAIDPAIGAIFMSASTVIVAVNAVLLKRASLD